MAAGRDQQTSGLITVTLGNLLRDHSESDVTKRLSTFAWGDATDVIDRVRQIVGCRLVGLHCTDRTVDGYREHGFTHIGRDATDNRNFMVAFIG